VTPVRNEHGEARKQRERGLERVNLIAEGGEAIKFNGRAYPHYKYHTKLACVDSCFRGTEFPIFWRLILKSYLVDIGDKIEDFGEICWQISLAFRICMFIFAIWRNLIIGFVRIILKR